MGLDVFYRGENLELHAAAADVAHVERILILHAEAKVVPQLQLGADGLGDFTLGLLQQVPPTRRDVHRTLHSRVAIGASLSAYLSLLYWHGGAVRPEPILEQLGSLDVIP